MGMRGAGQVPSSNDGSFLKTGGLIVCMETCKTGPASHAYVGARDGDLRARHGDDAATSGEATLVADPTPRTVCEAAARRMRGCMRAGAHGACVGLVNA